MSSKSLSDFSVIDSIHPMEALENPVAKYVDSHGGNFVISKILIANNGLAAAKEIKSIRKWSFETFGFARQVKLIVMATRDDIEANAEFIKLSDNYVEVPSGPNNFNYANVDLITELASQLKVDVNTINHPSSQDLPFIRQCGQVGDMLRRILDFPIYWISANPLLPLSDHLAGLCEPLGIRFLP